MNLHRKRPDPKGKNVIVNEFLKFLMSEIFQSGNAIFSRKSQGVLSDVCGNMTWICDRKCAGYRKIWENQRKVIGIE